MKQALTKNFSIMKTLKLILATIVTALFLASCNNGSFEKQQIISEYYNSLTPDQQDSLKIQLSKLCR